MIILNEEILNNEGKKYLTVEKEKELLNFMHESQNKIKNFILDTMQQVAVSTDYNSENTALNLSEYVDDLKECLNLCNENISSLNNISNL